MAQTELKDGMKEFDEKGTSKLKELTDGDLSDLFERIKALSSDDLRLRDLQRKSRRHGWPREVHYRDCSDRDRGRMM